MDRGGPARSTGVRSVRATVSYLADDAERVPGRTPDAVRFLHLDHSGRSAPELLAQTVGLDRDEAAPYGRVVAVSTWRSLTPPPQDVPLKVCDQRSSSLDDLVVVDAHLDRPDARGIALFEAQRPGPPLSAARWWPSRASVWAPPWWAW